MKTGTTSFPKHFGLILLNIVILSLVYVGIVFALQHFGIINISDSRYGILVLILITTIFGFFIGFYSVPIVNRLLVKRS